MKAEKYVPESNPFVDRCREQRRRSWGRHPRTLPDAPSSAASSDPRSARLTLGRAVGRAAMVCIAGFASLISLKTLAQHPTHAVHPLMTKEGLIVRCQMLNLPSSAAVVTPLAIQSPMMEQQPNQLIELPAGAPPIRVLRFLPNATMEQSVVPAVNDGGRPAIEVSIEGSTQSYRRWLLADDPDRNRLTSYIGGWRFMSVADRAERDALFKLFETEFTRDPMLIVSRTGGGGGRRLAIHVDDVQSLDDLGGKIRVRKFYPDYAMDRTTSIPINQSDRRRNPAALVDIEHDGVTETRWVFAKFPGFQSRESDQLPYQVTLDCPAESASNVPDFALVTVGRQTIEVWQRDAGATTSRPLDQDAAIAIPNSQYRFRVSKFVPSARMVEVYRSVEKGKGGPALEIEYVDAAGTTSRLWLELGHNRTVGTPVGSMMVTFDNKEKDAPQGIHP